tara:strand:- start:433 stop:786 length:354 start_codon:yes stop_codon:yes gene_type:complete
MNKDKAVQQIQKMLGDKHIHLTDIISQVVQDVNVISGIKIPNGKITDHVPMPKERYIWYRNEIERLRKLDKQISDKVRATYSIYEMTKEELEMKEALMVVQKLKKNTNFKNWTNEKR